MSAFLDFLILMVIFAAFTVALQLLLIYQHRRSIRFGLAPLMLMLGALAVLLQTQNNYYIEPLVGFRLYMNSAVLVPLMLSTIAILYIVNGTYPARVAIFGIALATLLAYAIPAVFQAQTLFSFGRTNPDSVVLINRMPEIRIAFASISSFIVDSFIIVVFYQGIRNAYPKAPMWALAGIALVAASLTDMLVFQFVADLGTPKFLVNLAGDTLGKTICALVCCPLMGIYLARIAPKLPNYAGDEKRPTFDLVFGTFDQLRLRLSSVQAELTRSEQTRLRQRMTYVDALETERERTQDLRDSVSEATHDIKSPLTALNLKLYSLNKSEDPLRRALLMQDLVNISERIERMLDHLSILSHLEEQIPLIGTTVDLNQLLRGLAEIFQPLAEAKSLEFKRDLNAPSALVMANVDELTRVFSNLLQNAVNYTQSGWIRVETLNEGDQVVARVSDSGLGISGSDQARLFQRFFRGTNAKQVDGTGLGLVIVKKIVAHHQGRITVESKVGTGTTFSVSLPNAARQTRN